MLLSFILFLLNPVQSSTLDTHLTYRNGVSICTVNYKFPAGSSNRAIEYKTVSDTDWTILIPEGSGGQETIEILEERAVYEIRLRWQLNGPKTSSPNFFIPYENAESTEPIFDYFRLNIPTEERGGITSKLYNTVLSFSYQDKYKSDEPLRGEIFDSDNSVVGRFVIPKDNKSIYHLDLVDLTVNWEAETRYFLKLFDDKNIDRWLNFELIGTESTIQASILANAISVDCEVGLESTIQFLANLEGGVGPYDLSWIVSDLNTGNLLSGPINSTARSSDEIPSITVDFPLPYRVTLGFFDSCGRFAETNVTVSCEDESNSNTVLIENLNGSGTTSGGNGETN